MAREALCHHCRVTLGSCLASQIRYAGFLLHLLHLLLQCLVVEYTCKLVTKGNHVSTSTLVYKSLSMTQHISSWELAYVVQDANSTICMPFSNVAATVLEAPTSCFCRARPCCSFCQKKLTLEDLTRHPPASCC